MIPRLSAAEAAFMAARRREFIRFLRLIPVERQERILARIKAGWDPLIAFEAELDQVRH
jgi:hypothetical protein